MNLKVLPLPYYWDSKWLRKDLIPRHNPITPRFNRKGFYKLGNKAWVELGDGQAFEYLLSQFEMELELLNVESLRPEEINAIKTVGAVKSVSTRKQRELLFIIKLYEQCQLIKRSSQLHRLKFFKVISNE